MTIAAHLPTVPPEQQREIEAWRAEKDRELRGPDSPLGYVGPRTLQPGHHLLGSGAQTDLRFESPGVPEIALDFLAQDVRLRLIPALPLVALNGEPSSEADLRPGDRVGVGPLEIRYQGHGPAGAMISIRDQSRPALLAYRGLHYLPVDPRYRVEATFEPAVPGQTLTLETTQHQQRQLPLRGTLHFTILGQKLSLQGFALDRPGDLFVVFRDGSSGQQTYGAGRFLWVKGPIDGKTTVDFNLAWNPLCAYSTGYNCPLAPPANRLRLPIPVGEASYEQH